MDNAAIIDLQVAEVELLEVSYPLFLFLYFNGFNELILAGFKNFLSLHICIELNVAGDGSITHAPLDASQ